MTSPIRRTLAALRSLAFVFLALCTLSALADSLQVNPIRIDLSAKAPTAALTVKNNGTEPVMVQAMVAEWSQQHGTDIYVATREVLVTPPIVTIPAGAERIIRAGLRRQPDAQKELSYRLFIQEVPPRVQPDFQGVVVALRVGLPVFVQPREAKVAPRLVWHAKVEGGGTIRLRAINEGNAHVQLSELQVFAAGGEQPVAGQSGLAYVLPGKEREWVLALRSPMPQGAAMRVKAVTDAGNCNDDVKLSSW